MSVAISGPYRIGASGNLEKCEKVELQEGQIIWLNGYGQSEHWHERKVVFKREETRYGAIYHAVNIDVDPPVISRYEAFTIRPVDQIFGIGTYYTPGEMFEGSHQELDQMIFKALEHQRQEAERRNAEADRLKALEEAGKKVWAKMEVAGAKSLIVAELKEDRSDLMTDYFHSVTVKTVILGTSKTNRNNFKELRKLAAQSSIPEIQVLATAVPEHEHRENYSGGAGYYLGESNYSGWIIRKVPPYREYLQELGKEELN
ncbi:MAG: hypothetical protein HGB01_06900 [Chlorobiaceae bacterium]|nr:hypothetical protein [Chlorobiaceae bacterium]